MIVNTEKRMPANKDILIFTYGGIRVMVPLESKDGVLSADLQEKAIADLMNLCILELKDIKRIKLLKHDEDQGRVKFYGVDYS